MDPLLERFRFLLRSMMQDPFRGNESDLFSGVNEDHDHHRSSDFNEAWEELDDFLNSGQTGNYRREEGPVRSKTRSDYAFGPPEELRPDYQLLGVPFGASFPKVKEGYKREMRRHHPDLHGTGPDPEKSKQATAKAQRINVAFQRIRAWEIAKKGG